MCLCLAVSLPSVVDIWCHVKGGPKGLCQTVLPSDPRMAL